MWNKVTLLDMKWHYQCFTIQAVSILIQGNAIWYFRCWWGNVRGFLFTAGERGSLSLIKQSGMTNKIVVLQLLPWVSQLFQGNELTYTFHTQGDQQYISIFTVSLFK